MRKLLVSVALALTALASICATPALAAPTAGFTSSTATPQVGIPIRFDAQADCVTNRCDWSWVFYNKYGQILNGGQMGSGTTVTYTFTAFAASKPYVIVKLKVTEPGGTNNYALAQHAYVVT
jgi:hypothetical protein